MPLPFDDEDLLFDDASDLLDDTADGVTDAFGQFYGEIDDLAEEISEGVAEEFGRVTNRRQKPMGIGSGLGLRGSRRQKQMGVGSSFGYDDEFDEIDFELDEDDDEFGRVTNRRQKPMGIGSGLGLRGNRRQKPMGIGGGGFGFEDLDEDDEFGVFYGADDVEDDIDTALSELEADIDLDLDEEYGVFYGAAEAQPESAPIAYEPLVSTDQSGAQSLWKLFMPDVIPTWAQDWLLPDWASAMTIEGEAQDLANHLVRVQRSYEGGTSFAHWPSLSRSDKADVLGTAIGQATFGQQVDSYYVLEDAWNEGRGVFGTIQSLASASPQALATFVQKDVWEGIKSTVPQLWTTDQNVNSLAIAYWLAHKVGATMRGYNVPGYGDLGAIDPYPALISAIDSVWQSGNVRSVGLSPTPVVTEPWVPEDIPAQPRGVSLPRPQTILGLGYVAQLVVAAVEHGFKMPKLF